MKQRKQVSQAQVWHETNACSNDTEKLAPVVNSCVFPVSPEAFDLFVIQNQEEFITSTIDFLRQRDFDGIDLDFEYPGARGSGEGDKWKFAQLVKVRTTDPGKFEPILFGASGAFSRQMTSTFLA